MSEDSTQAAGRYQQGMFHGYTHVSGGNFTNVEGNHSVHNYTAVREPGLQRLREQIAVEGMHNSKERFPAPNCHPGTREEALEVLKRWIASPPDHSRILWLNGAPGVGKSAILQELADALLGVDRDVVASFFFGRGKGKRELAQYLFPTIAYQLATYIPDLRALIDRAVDLDPMPLEKNIRAQFQSLILGPLQQLPSPVLLPKVILIDGLDECCEHAMQQAIVDAIGKGVDQSDIPIRFIIASRPEFHITAAFRKPELKGQTRAIALDDTFPAWKDIRKYYTDSFEDIRERNADILPNLSADWPGKEIIEHLVQMASGQFIFARTVVGFVDDPDALPTTRLEIILDPAHRSKAFSNSNLDDLYSQILSTHPHPSLMKSVIGVVLGQYLPLSMTVNMIGDILQIPPGEILVVVRRLKSLLTVLPAIPPERPFSMPVEIMHASFRDYIMDPERSGSFYVDPTDYRDLAIVNSFARLSQLICQQMASASSSSSQGIQSLSEDTIEYLNDGVWGPSTASVIESLRSLALRVEQTHQNHHPQGHHCKFDPTQEAFRSLFLVIDILKHAGDYERELAAPYLRIFPCYMHQLLKPDRPLGEFLTRFPEFGNRSLNLRSLLGYCSPKNTRIRTRVDEFIRCHRLNEYEEYHAALIPRCFSLWLLGTTSPESPQWDYINSQFGDDGAIGQISELFGVAILRPELLPGLRHKIFQHLNAATYWHSCLQSAPFQVVGHVWNTVDLAFQWGHLHHRFNSNSHAGQKLMRTIYAQVLDLGASGDITLRQPFITYLSDPDSGSLYVHWHWLSCLPWLNPSDEQKSVCANGFGPEPSIEGAVDDGLPTLSPYLFLFDIRKWGDLAGYLTDPAAAPFYVGPMETLRKKVRALQDVVSQQGSQAFTDNSHAQEVIQKHLRWALQGQRRLDSDSPFLYSAKLDLQL